VVHARYAYARPSAVGDAIALSTFHLRDGHAQRPYFFEGRAGHPTQLGLQLLTVSQIVRTRFHDPTAPWQLDPVVTASERALRFEGFSGCGGVYVRADLSLDGFEVDHLGRGTTNVDFHEGMRRALARLRAQSGVRLSVGADAIALAEDGGERVVEKKVALPQRWLRGFAEVSAYLPRLSRAFEVSGSEARRFVRSLPTGGGRHEGWVVPVGRGLRWSVREQRGAVRLTGPARVGALEPVLRHATALVVYGAPSGTSAWEVHGPTGRFCIAVSPELSRGFSGEGQVLSDLAGDDWEHALPRIRARLAWQGVLRPEHVAVDADVPLEAAAGALAALGTRGLVGYDLHDAAYFHRELPFDLGAVLAQHPRLRGARELVADGAVRMVSPTEVFVRSGELEHRVLLGDEDRCTCAWWARHQGRRGPCKHVLAARLAVGG
jgi:hypothetical protein